MSVGRNPELEAANTPSSNVATPGPANASPSSITQSEILEPDALGSQYQEIITTPSHLSHSITDFTQPNIGVIYTPSRPVANKSFKEISLVERFNKKAAHMIFRAIENIDDETITYFYKRNLPSKKPHVSSDVQASISELEATCADFYRLLAPFYIPKTYAIYDDNRRYIGVISEEFSEYKSIAEDPLKESDLDITHLQDRIYSVLDASELKLIATEKQIEKCNRVIKKCELDEIRYKAKLKEVQKSSEVLAGDTDVLRRKFSSTAKRKDEAYAQDCHQTKALREFYENLKHDYRISREEFERFRMIKGLAITLVCSYIFMEDDLHQNNLSKNGRRIDFDMSLWSILYDFKDGSIDLTYRQPTKKSLEITEYDILHFPNLKDFLPFYWPTNASTFIAEAAMQIAKTFGDVSTNAYSSIVNNVFKKLEKHPVFVYYKYATLFKFVLLDPRIFRSIAQLHIQAEAMINSKSVIDIIADFMTARLEGFKKTLYEMPEFLEFIFDHGEVVYQEVTGEWMDQDALHEHEIESLGKELETLQVKMGETSNHKKNCEDQMERLAKMIPTITESVVSAQSASSGEMAVKTKFEERASLLTQKLDEIKTKRTDFDAIDKTLKELEKIHAAKETLRKAHASQIIDISHAQTVYRALCRDFETRQKSQPIPTRTAKASSPAMSSMRGLFKPLSVGSRNSPSKQPSASSSISTPKTITYDSLKTKTIAALNTYIKPGITGLLGFMRTHIDDANLLIDYAKQLQPQNDAEITHMIAINDLKVRLENEVKQLEQRKDNGGLYTALVALLKDEEWSLTAKRSGISASF